jgi:hypothetical protein
MGLKVTRLGRTAIFFLAVALAIVLSIFIQSDSSTTHPFTTYAAPGVVESCSVCHKSAVTCDDCTECHIPTIIYLFGESGLYQAHHDLVSQAIIPPATTVLESCIDAECHDGSDARYVTSIDSNHTYCRICHGSGAGGVDPGPNDCLGCHID